MLKITPDQIDHLSTVGGDDDRWVMVEGLRQNAPERVAHLDDGGVMALLCEGEAHARRHGVTTGIGCSTLAMYYVVLGPDYMRDESMRAIFDMPGLTMDDKALMLARACMDLHAEGG